VPDRLGSINADEFRDASVKTVSTSLPPLTGSVQHD
jgi:hypothetical protein